MREVPVLEARDPWAPAAQAAGLPMPARANANEGPPGIATGPTHVRIDTPPTGGHPTASSPGNFTLGGSPGNVGPAPAPAPAPAPTGGGGCYGFGNDTSNFGLGNPAGAFSTWIPTQHCQTMPKLTGERGGYKYWAGRIRDHLIECHPKWGEVVDDVLTKHEPITRAQLQASATDGVNQWQIAEALYA